LERRRLPGRGRYGAHREADRQSGRLPDVDGRRVWLPWASPQQLGGELVVVAPGHNADRLGDAVSAPDRGQASPRRIPAALLPVLLPGRGSSLLRPANQAAAWLPRQVGLLPPGGGPGAILVQCRAGTGAAFLDQRRLIAVRHAEPQLALHHGLPPV